ncbi:MAG: ABC transporter permease [Gemmatimonadales bacterium]
MVIAVAALCATAVFGASLTHLTSTPALFGAPEQAQINPQPGQAPTYETAVRQDTRIGRITLGTAQQIFVNDVGVTVLVGKAVRGPLLVSVVDGHFPTGTGEIALGSTTMRQVHARLGSIVRVTAPVFSGGTRTTPFRVVARVSIPGDTGSGGLGSGAGMTLDGYLNASCPPGPTQAQCMSATGQNLPYVLLISGVPGRQGQAAIAHYLTTDAAISKRPVTPTSLVNFGEAVNFPLILGAVLVVFGAATLVHLLVVSVARRRRETGLLKALGFVNGQIGATVCWQATTVATVGIVIGVPLGVALGQVVWRAFATNLGVVPVSAVPAWVIALLAMGVVLVSNVLAIAPALAAARSNSAGQLLRTQ